MLALGDISLWLPVYGAGLFLALVGKFAHCESRALLLGVCLAVIAPSPASLVVAGIISLVIKGFDVVHVGK